jgi:hypothetical protein
MTPPAIHKLAIASIVTLGLTGCQSGPRWAWWKHPDGAGNTSAVAQATAPVLPSQEANPQPVDVPGLQPAASPSAANLAAAQAPAGVPALSLPATSASTIANAPLANYPPSSSPATTLSSTSSPDQSLTMPSSSTLIANVPPAGPYDLNGYKAADSIATTAATAVRQTAVNPGGYAATTTDRYATPAANTPLPPVDAQFAAASTMPPVAAPVAGVIDRYAAPALTANDVKDMSANSSEVPQPLHDTLSTAFAASPVPITPPQVAAAQASTLSPIPGSPIDIAPSSAATVQLSLPPGKYRPGGTSDYTDVATSQRLEVATRPTPPQTTSSPVSASDPWSPPASSMPASGGAVGTY